MPAVTVEDTLVLPRVAEPGPGTSADRTVRTITTAPKGYEGEGFPVRRAFAGVDLKQLDPFIHMDQMGEVDYAPGEPKGTPWHPHRGFETVTYMIDGIFRHQDSNGGGGPDHQRRHPVDDGRRRHPAHRGAAGGARLKGGLFHGFQLWVNLPAKLENGPAPRYQDIRAGTGELLSSPDGGALLRVIAGEVGGRSGPGETHTPITIVHATLSPGAQLEAPVASPRSTPLPTCWPGPAPWGPSTGRSTRPARGLRPGRRDHRSAAESRRDGPSAQLDILLLGGRPIREPVAAYGAVRHEHPRRSWCRRSTTSRRAARQHPGGARHGAGGAAPRSRRPDRSVPEHRAACPGGIRAGGSGEARRTDSCSPRGAPGAPARAAPAAGRSAGIPTHPG